MIGYGKLLSYDYGTVTFYFLLLGLKSFCIGKSSGIYTNPFEQKSFVVCSNGVSEERQCPEAMLFNPKEKMCDVPDQRNTMRTKKRKETTKKWLRRSRWWFLLHNICLMEVTFLWKYMFKLKRIEISIQWKITSWITSPFAVPPPSLHNKTSLHLFSKM